MEIKKKSNFSFECQLVMNIKLDLYLIECLVLLQDTNQLLYFSYVLCFYKLADQMPFFILKKKVFVVVCKILPFLN